MRNLFSGPIKGRGILFLFIITTTVYLIMLLVTIPKLMTFSNGEPIMDMMPGGYAAPYVADLLQSLGDEGRSYYLTKQLPLDFAYPGLFAITYSLIFIYFLRQINRHDTWWRLIALLPVIAGLADYLENISIISMINQFPNVSTTLVKFSSMVSIVKASATTIYFLFLVVLLVTVAIIKARHRPQN